MYQALYRKWRPKSFADVVGQEHITETLRRQVEQGRLSHAYLFTGTRGTGKTTCAKILSKAVNCEHPVNGDPCNQCDACLGIDNGSLLDVLELDAASNNGVDHVRALRDEAIYAPARVKYRVYIVDEVHMLSTAAFNALLKILEEPPAHLIFILATTELHKVPATILSRCQRFAFKRIQPMDIASRLQHVARVEGMTLNNDAAQLLARLADGALRDALSLLDQCGVSGMTVDSARVLDVLGLAGNVRTVQLMEHIAQRDVQSALMQLDQLYSGGKDISALLNELSTLTRDILIRMTAPEGGLALLSGAYDLGTVDTLAQTVSAVRLIYMATQIQNTLAGLPMSTNRRTDAELCLMRLCDESLCGDVTALSARLARLEEGGIPAAASGPAQANVSASIPAHVPAPAPPTPAFTPAAAADAPPWEEPVSVQGKVNVPAGKDEPPLPDDFDAPPAYDDSDAPPPYGEPVVAAAPAAPVPVPVTPAPAAYVPEEKPAAGNSEIWWALIERYKERLQPMYWFMLDDASGELDGDVLLVRCGDDLTRDSLDCPAIVEVLRTVTEEYLKRSVGVRFTVGKREQTQTAEDRLEALIRVGSKYENFTVK